MKKTLYEILSEYSTASRFHVPGHSGKDIDGALFKSARFDVTELPFSDNLNNPTTVIRDVEKKVLSAYRNCFFINSLANDKENHTASNEKVNQQSDAAIFTTGATSAIHAALFACRKFGAEILVEKNCHKSVYAALKMFGFRPFFIENRTDEYGFSIPLSAADIVAAYEKYPAKTIILTSPDYLGRTASALKNGCPNPNNDDTINGHSDIKTENSDCVSGYPTKTSVADIKLSEILKNCKLIIDAAHGSHFAFSPLFPQKINVPIACMILSFHKTLPVFTGGAALVGESDILALSKVYRAEMTTSSPSYVTMASIDFAVSLFQNEGKELYKNLFNNVEAFKSALPQFTFLPNDDFSRIVFNCPENSLINVGVYPEMSAGGFSVLIATPFNGEALADLAEKLKNVQPSPTVKSACDINDILDKDSCFADTASDNFSGISFSGGFKGIELLPLNEALGRTLYLDMGIYPPGIPQILAGTKLTRAHIRYLEKNKSRIFNFQDDKVCVIIDNAEK